MQPEAMLPYLNVLWPLVPEHVKRKDRDMQPPATTAL